MTLLFLFLTNTLACSVLISNIANVNRYSSHKQLLVSSIIFTSVKPESLRTCEMENTNMKESSYFLSQEFQVWFVKTPSKSLRCFRRQP